eukprot:TRINITY_DN17103_c0_g2_i1.p1 TRINITY_DN17103_c0_g2~~TRINITY_DN17103_c0_g2_i1.p1  ORF type:complete len:313 (-),score=51.33 TRINITY_DN17103_c0_g2_i1:57-995(-)
MHPILVVGNICVLIYFIQHSSFLLALGCLSLLFFLFSDRFIQGPEMSTRRKLMFASWAPPSEGQIFGALDANATKLVAFVDKWNASGKKKVTVTALALKAAALAMRVSPGLNGVYVLGKFVPHKSIDVSCLIALDEGKDLASAKIERCDEKSILAICEELGRKADKLRAHKDDDFEKSKPLLKMMPVSLLRPVVHTVGWLSSALGLNIPALGVRPYPFGSVMVTSVGMLGVEEAFVPFTPWSHVPVLLMIGSIADKAVVVDGKVVPQKMLHVTATLDHRYVDGSEIARLAKKLKYYLENPEFLDAAEESKEP